MERDPLNVKTRVCKDCKKRKKISQFHWQKPPRICKIKQHKPHRRTECKTCHNKKCRKAYHARTTRKQRAKYMRIYMLTYNRNRRNTLPSQYRIAA